MDQRYPVNDRQRLTDAIGLVLVQQGLPRGSANISLRSFGSTDAEIPALLVFVRLNEWKPEILLRGKIIEKRVRDTLRKTLRVRIGYLFWRIGSDVQTPDDPCERFHVRSSADRLEALAAQSHLFTAAPRVHAPLTDWSDFDEPDR